MRLMSGDGVCLAVLSSVSCEMSTYGVDNDDDDDDVEEEDGRRMLKRNQSK